MPARGARVGHDEPVTRPPPPIAAREGASPFVVRLLVRVGDRVPALARIGDVSIAVGVRYGRHRGSVLAAGFAFYALLAVVPAAIALGSVAAWAGDPTAVSDALNRAVDRVPSLQGSAQDVIGSLIEVVQQTSSTTFGITTLVSTLLAVYAASRVLVTATAILDLAFDRARRERSWLVRVVATFAVLGLLVAIVIGLVVLQALPPVLNAFGVGSALAGVVRWVTLPLVLVIGYLLYSAAYRIGSPSMARIGWLNRGGAVAMLIAVMGTVGTTLYITLSSTWSAAIAVLGGAVVVQLWLYVLGLALVIGAEVEAVLIEPDVPPVRSSSPDTAAATDPTH
jgi:membrane protein